MRRVTAQAQFAASHRDTKTCGPHPHGHTFHVTATEYGGLASTSLLEDLQEVVGELHQHSLDDMLPAVSQDLEAMSAWIMERLAMRHQGLTTVSMWMADRPDERIGSEREIRR